MNQPAKKAFSKGKIYLYSQTIKRPYSGVAIGTRIYAFSHVVYRMAFGKTPTPDTRASTIDSWSSCGDMQSTAEYYERQGYTVAYA